MYTAALLDTDTLSLQMRQAFAALTGPDCRHCLHGETFYRLPQTTSIAIGAFQQEQPVGLLLASLIPAFNVIEIHSLFVKEEHRHHKVATLMLSELEQYARQKQCALLTIIYPNGEPTTPYLERLLQAKGWAPPKRFGLTCRFDGPTFNPPWLSREYPLSPHFQIFSWTEISPEERAILQKRKEQGEIPGPLFPFKEPEKIEPLNSLGLRYKNQVVGWMITHRIAPDTIRYSALYILREFQYRKEAIILLQQSIKLQLSSSVRWGVLELNIAHVEPSWMTFVKHRLIPYAESVKYLKQVHRNLHL
jgi:GNAT superfamily N-acetyltransferase